MELRLKDYCLDTRSSSKLEIGVILFVFPIPSVSIF